MEYGLGQFHLSWRPARWGLVLILVLMEYGLGRDIVDWAVNHNGSVLILVLMEYGLGPTEVKAVHP